MASRIIEELQVGELVKWFEPYADGLMTKDAGFGIILRINEHNIGITDEPYINYTVYRNKHSDTMRFEIREVERINVEK